MQSISECHTLKQIGYYSSRTPHVGATSVNYKNSKLRPESPKLDKKIGKTLPVLMKLQFCCNIQIHGSEFAVNNIKACKSIHPELSRVVVYLCGRDFFWHTLGLLETIENCFNAMYCAAHVHPFMTSVYPSSNGYQQDNTPCRKAKIFSKWFLEHVPDLNPIEHLWGLEEGEILNMDVKPANLQQMNDTIISTQTKISEKCLQHLVESMPRK